MITWMQRHKKWLVITIWISTIAFVGAGFVGWGSYNFGSSSGSVAVVGDRKISVDEYQREYSSLYEQYSKIFGTQFNKAMAEKLKLKELAYQTVIQKNLILSYADDIGLDVTNEEIAKELVSIPGFLKNGKFDKDTYIKVLNQNRTKPQQFEAQLKRDLLLKKVESLFKIKANNEEIKDLNKLLFSEDKLSIKILDAKNITVQVKEDELKKFWEKNKNSYKSLPAVKLQYFTVKPISKEYTKEQIEDRYKNFRTDYRKADGKIKSLDEAKDDIISALNLKTTKKEALKKYLRLKKGEDKFIQEETVFEKDLNYGLENNKKIEDSIPGTILKPFLNNNEYIIVKVINKVSPKVLTFDKARNDALVDYKKQLKEKELEKIAKNDLKNFNGESLGYVSRTSIDKINGLNHQEALTFLNKLFSSSKKEGKINLNDKIVLYKIDDSKLAKYDASKNVAIKKSIDNLLNQELMNNLIKSLQKTYEVKSSIKFEE